jgi:hypothetical protein
MRFGKQGCASGTRKKFGFCLGDHQDFLKGEARRGRFVCDKAQFELADDAIDKWIVRNEVENTNDKP